MPEFNAIFRDFFHRLTTMKDTQKGKKAAHAFPL